MNTLPAFEHSGTAELITTPVKGLLHICREHYHYELREAIAHCQLAPLKHATRHQILTSALRRRAYLRM